MRKKRSLKNSVTGMPCDREEARLLGDDKRIEMRNRNRDCGPCLQKDWLRREAESVQEPREKQIRDGHMCRPPDRRVVSNREGGEQKHNSVPILHMPERKR